MSDTISYRLWCHVEGDSTAFSVLAPSAISIDELKKLIKEEGVNATERTVLAKDLVLWKVRMTMASDSTTNFPAG
jgi:hypothetical protein